MFGMNDTFPTLELAGELKQLRQETGQVELRLAYKTVRKMVLDLLFPKLTILLRLSWRDMLENVAEYHKRPGFVERYWLVERYGKQLDAGTLGPLAQVKMFMVLRDDIRRFAIEVLGSDEAISFVGQMTDIARFVEAVDSSGNWDEPRSAEQI